MVSRIPGIPVSALTRTFPRGSCFPGASVRVLPCIPGRVQEKLFVEDKQSFYSGRPDIIFEHCDGSGGIEKVEVGDVKYMDRKPTFKQGLEELIEYMYYAREGSEYLVEKVNVEGILVVDHTIEINRKKFQNIRFLLF